MSNLAIKRLILIIVTIVAFSSMIYAKSNPPPDQSTVMQQSSLNYELTFNLESSPGSSITPNSAVPTLPQTSLMYEAPPPVSALPVYNYNSALNQTRHPSAISSQSANIINFHAGKTTQFNPVNLNNYYDEALSYATNILKMPIYSNINT